MGACARIVAIVFDCAFFVLTAVSLWAVYDDIATDSVRRAYEERLLRGLIAEEASSFYSSPLGAPVRGSGSETPRLLFKHTDASSSFCGRRVSLSTSDGDVYCY